MAPKRTGAAARAMRVAAVSAGATGSYLGYLAQRLFLDPRAREEKLRAAHRSAARRISDEMADLKGPLMKLGQTLSLHTDALPAEAIEELTRLQMQAPGMHPSLVRAQIRASMGRGPEQLFGEFDAEPFAAASLGQVHRARTKSGDEVAVKVQYPGLEDAIASDFSWFRKVALPARLTRHLPDSTLDELQEQLVAEADYRREANNARLFRERLAPLGIVHVPRIYDELSGDRVLTMELVHGQHLDAFLAGKPSRKLRDLIGARLFEMYYYQVLRMEALHADPHWGNYLLRDDGTIGLVDFGCVKYLPPAFVANLRKAFLYAGPRTSPEFMRLMEERYAPSGTKLTKAGKAALANFADNFYGKVYPPDPRNDAKPFDFSDGAFLKDYMSAAGGLMRSRASLPEYLFLARTEIGLYQTLHRLGARVTTSRIVRKYL